MKKKSLIKNGFVDESNKVKGQREIINFLKLEIKTRLKNSIMKFPLN